SRIHDVCALPAEPSKTARRLRLPQQCEPEARYGDIHHGTRRVECDWDRHRIRGPLRIARSEAARRLAGDLSGEYGGDKPHRLRLSIRSPFAVTRRRRVLAGGDRKSVV